MNQLTELRSIIVGDQQEALQKLKRKLEESQVDALKVAKVMPESVRLSLSENGKLAAELKPFVAETVMDTIEDDPSSFAEVLYPVLVPAIRLMIANSVRSFVQTMNRSIESTTTVQGLKWRMESMRTGVPYSEVAIRKTLEYRVEQVFLIERDAGLLIDHLVNENINGLDSDAVAGMFAAIQSFVRDSFSSSNQDDNLTHMNVGELDVWLVHSSYTTLACVIRGNAPYELRGQLEQVQDDLYASYARELKGFDGSHAINGVRELLEPCLQLRLKEFNGEKDKRKKAPFMSYVLVAVLASAVIYFVYSGYKENIVQQRVESLLFVTPGILPTQVEWIEGKLHVVGLKDPSAKLPWQRLNELGVTKEMLNVSLKTLKSYTPLNK